MVGDYARADGIRAGRRIAAIKPGERATRERLVAAEIRQGVRNIFMAATGAGSRRAASLSLLASADVRDPQSAAGVAWIGYQASEKVRRQRLLLMPDP